MQRGKLILLFSFFVMGATQADDRAEKAKSDYQSLADKHAETARPHGNLDPTLRRFAIFKAADRAQNRVLLLLDGDTEPKEWPLRAGAELWCSGWWGRLDQFLVGDRVWIWFDKEPAQQLASITRLTDELSEQVLYTPCEVKSVDLADLQKGTLTLESSRAKKPVARTLKLTATELSRGNFKAPISSLKPGEKIFVQSSGDVARILLDNEAMEMRRHAQMKLLRQRWADEGVPGMLIFSYPERHEFELMLDHEAMQWARSLREGDRVILQVDAPISAVVRQLRPWRERTQLLLAADDPATKVPELTADKRISLRLAHPPVAQDEPLPAGVGNSPGKPQRIEWIMASIYCTCGMHDGCAGHVFTLAACDAGPGHTCGLARSTRQLLGELIDSNQTDQQILDRLRNERGPNLIRPHMLP